MSWRLVDSDLRPPAYTAACDEAILTARNLKLVPTTLHLYRREVPTISLGYFEKVEECVDLEAATNYGAKLVRRMSGGSAIYTDQDQIIYSLILDRSQVPESPNDTFPLVCQGIIDTLQYFGIQGEFKPVNDVLVNGRKISGSAQVRRWGVVVQHGTLIVRADYERLLGVLKQRKRTRAQMTSLADELGFVPPMEEVKSALVKGFSSAFNVEIEPGQLIAKERELTQELMKSKYGSAEHTFRR